jgi:hypothetical protein
MKVIIHHRGRLILRNCSDIIGSSLKRCSFRTSLRLSAHFGTILDTSEKFKVINDKLVS